MDSLQEEDGQLQRRISKTSGRVINFMGRARKLAGIPPSKDDAANVLSEADWIRAELNATFSGIRTKLVIARQEHEMVKH